VLFVYPLLNKLIKKAVCIFSMQGMKATLHFERKKTPTRFYFSDIKNPTLYVGT
jgi:hypothetical protein